MFDHLKKLDVKERIARLELPEVAPDAWIEGRPANESNPQYFNALMRKSAKALRGDVPRWPDVCRSTRLQPATGSGAVPGLCLDQLGRH